MIRILERPQLENTIMVEGLPGIGLVGKLAADHMLDELNAKKFAELYSYYLPPQINIKQDNTVDLVNMSFYYKKGDKNDLIILLGDFQGITPDSQYLIADRTLDFAEEFNVGRLFTLGGLGTGAITKTPKVFGAATSRELVEELGRNGVVFRGNGAIFGASGLLLGLGMLRGMEAACLMGETHGQIIDAKSAESVLIVLTKILGIEVDMAALEEKAKKTEEQMKQVSSMMEEQKKAVDRAQKFADEIPSYIR